MRHGHLEKVCRRIHGLERDPIYAVWSNMLKRCEDPRNKSYHNYGGRGITVCPEWHDVTRFNNDVCGHPGGGLTFDRIDVNGNYEPGNVRWVSPAVQAQNRRNNKLSHDKARAIRLLTAKGLSRRELAKRYAVDKTMIAHIVAGRAWQEAG